MPSIHRGTLARLAIPTSLATAVGSALLLIGGCGTESSGSQGVPPAADRPATGAGSPAVGHSAAPGDDHAGHGTIDVLPVASPAEALTPRTGAPQDQGVPSPGLPLTVLAASGGAPHAAHGSAGGGHGGHGGLPAHPATSTRSALATTLFGAPPVATGPVGTGHGAFQADCTFSHSSADDPIVFPGQPGKSHRHEFFGARTTNAFSTAESIRQSGTTCIRHNSQNERADRSAYWVPALYVNGRLVRATKLGAYYTTGFRRIQAIRPFPAGLKIVAGSASGGPQEVNGERVWAFLCPGGTLVNGTTTQAPTCRTNRMYMTIRFPDCWNGVDLDSADHSSHMAYSRRTGPGLERSCPTTHPWMMPQLAIQLRYPTAGGPGVRLAPGPVNTAHADFFNGWDPSIQRRLVEDCLNTDEYCGGNDAPVPGH